jgi:hypothetical protein
VTDADVWPYLSNHLGIVVLVLETGSNAGQLYRPSHFTTPGQRVRIGEEWVHSRGRDNRLIDTVAVLRKGFRWYAPVFCNKREFRGTMQRVRRQCRLQRWMHCILRNMQRRAG